MDPDSSPFIIPTIANSPYDSLLDSLLLSTRELSFSLGPIMGALSLPRDSNAVPFWVVYSNLSARNRS